MLSAVGRATEYKERELQLMPQLISPSSAFQPRVSLHPFRLSLRMRIVIHHCTNILILHCLINIFPNLVIKPEVRMYPKRGEGERMTKSGVEAKESMIDVLPPPFPFGRNISLMFVITGVCRYNSGMKVFLQKVRCWHYIGRYFNRLHFYFGMFLLQCMLRF